MTLFIDYAGRTVRLTDERRAHVLSHPEMLVLEPLLAEVIASPAVVVRSNTDDAVLLQYLDAITEPFGAKLWCAVVKHAAGDAFGITAYLTDKIKHGEVIWTRP